MGPSPRTPRAGGAISRHVSVARWAISSHVRGHGTVSPRVRGRQGHLPACPRPAGPSPCTSTWLERGHLPARQHGRMSHLPARPRPRDYMYTRASVDGRAISPRVCSRRGHLLARLRRAGSSPCRGPMGHHLARPRPRDYISPCASANGGVISPHIRGQRCHIPCASSARRAISSHVPGQRGDLPARPRPAGPSPRASTANGATSPARLRPTAPHPLSVRGRRDHIPARLRAWRDGGAHSAPSLRGKFLLLCSLCCKII